MPTGERTTFEDVDHIVAQTEAWLANLDPDAVEPDELPERQFSDRAGEVRIRAIPKKSSARGNRAAEVVGNPEPALAGWV